MAEAGDHTAEALATELEDALVLLEAYRPDGEGPDVREPLPSLLEQCQMLCEDIAPPEPVRTFHSLACTGGTLISKVIGALPNVALLSEIDPLSDMDIAKHGEVPRFAPTDIIHALNHVPRRIDNQLLLETFLASVETAAFELSQRGMVLILRDHAHSQFCRRLDWTKRPTLLEIVGGRLATHSLVAVRHPLDSFLALDANQWRQFHPFTLEEYSKRVTAFLDRYEHAPFIRYEDFVSEPEACLQRICDVLHLPFTPLVLDMISAVRMTGDSGRRGMSIAPRPRRSVPDGIEKDRRTISYVRLCERLDYEP